MSEQGKGRKRSYISIDLKSFYASVGTVLPLFLIVRIFILPPTLLLTGGNNLLHIAIFFICHFSLPYFNHYKRNEKLSNLRNL